MTENNTIDNFAIDVSWHQIPVEHHRGVLLGYLVLLQAVNGTDRKAIVKECLNASRYMGLPVPYRFTLYNITVVGYTVKGEGPVAQVSFLTPEDGNLQIYECN